ncbi:hypothetical protein Q5P01_004353 [Channa striata]|uniref:Uncharacterized protein n=1 Tax=Channa striata TaxID=64152 RepID=A0AA88NMJ1_CHASR|nr:hypothetical protein Q5P01_004353 [Channa striata]
MGQALNLLLPCSLIVGSSPGHSLRSCVRRHRCAVTSITSPAARLLGTASPRLQRDPAIYNLGHGKISMQEEEGEVEEKESYTDSRKGVKFQREKGGESKRRGRNQARKPRRNERRDTRGSR